MSATLWVEVRYSVEAPLGEIRILPFLWSELTGVVFRPHHWINSGVRIDFVTPVLAQVYIHHCNITWSFYPSCICFKCALIFNKHTRKSRFYVPLMVVSYRFCSPFALCPNWVNAQWVISPLPPYFSWLSHGLSVESICSRHWSMRICHGFV